MSKPRLLTGEVSFVVLLVGDIGGTNTRIALYKDGQLLRRSSFRNSEAQGFDDCLTAFLAAPNQQFHAAVIGVAGMVVNGTVRMTNLDWFLDENDLAQRLGVPVRLMNDFHIQALGALSLKSSDYEVLGRAVVRHPQKIVVLGAGTGLGEALIVQHRNEWVVMPGEGGHKRFAPKSEREIALLLQLSKTFPEHVSIERVVSGPGIENLYHALVQIDGDDLPDLSAPEITQKAIEGSCHKCSEALEIFTDTLADEAANLALQNSADCVFISGGIPVRILPLIRARFRQAFEAKGRYRAYLNSVEVRLVLRDEIALDGAALAAQALTKVP